MLIDDRINTLAHGLVTYSCDLKRGEKIWINAVGCDYQLVAAILREVYAVGGIPVVRLGDNRVLRELMLGMNEETAKTLAEYDAPIMADMQAFIGIRGGENSFEMADVPSEKTQIYSKFYNEPVHSELRVKNTKWVVLRYPTQGMSQLAGMSTEAYEDFYFNVCNLDYRKMSAAMEPLVQLMNKTDRVHIVGNGTDLSFSIKDIPAIKCDGLRNIPDGEVYTAPVKNSVNGVIRYNVPTIEYGIKFDNIELTFKDGKIIKATGSDTEMLNKILDTDDGARYVGEFALGVNPYITHAIGDILFDEKISGSIHFTPGQCYDDAFNGNSSAIHWDMVLCQTSKYGGGKIYFDDVLIRENGLFVLDSLKGLNPDALK